MRDYQDYETRDREHSANRHERSRSPFFGSDDRAYRPPERRSGWSQGRDRNRDPKYGSDAYRQGLARDETRRLIASDKVEGTPIYDINGRKLGSIQTLMLDKITGEVCYAVVRHSSGFLGLDERHFPLDWCDLTYDTRVHGYGVDFTEDELERQLSREEKRRQAMEDRDRDYGPGRDPRFHW